MIDPKELRIGNLVQSKINYLQQDHTTAVFIYNIRQIKDLKADVEAVIDGYRHFQKSTHLYYTDLSPIPLTEEWILKFGLRRDDECSTFPTSSKPDQKCYDYEIDEHHVISLHPDDGFSVCIKYFGTMYFETEEVFKIKYVHQLQNLYFALTGSELEINVIQNTAE